MVKRINKINGPINSIPTSDGRKTVLRISGLTRNKVIKCLKLQKILTDANNEIIDSIYDNGEIKEYKINKVICEQNDDGDFVYFILNGSVNVLIDNRIIAKREAKECVGEMSALDPTQKRCATLKAAEKSLVLRLTSDYFLNLVINHKEIMYKTTIELCERLLERSKYNKPRNKSPKIFIGSSKEGLSIARKLSKAIKCKDINLWETKVFKPSENYMESLLVQTEICDFAILVLTPDDKSQRRGKRIKIARDNLILELGMFIGSIGLKRSFILTTLSDIDLPSDLDGITILEYEQDENGVVDISAAAQKINEQIYHQGCK